MLFGEANGDNYYFEAGKLMFILHAIMFLADMGDVYFQFINCDSYYSKG